MRYSVKVTLDLLASGMTESGILEDYRDLEIENIRASLFFASRMMKVKSITHIKAAQYIKNSPKRILIVATGNISNKELLVIFQNNLDFIANAFEEGSTVIELNNEAIRIIS